MFRQIYLAMNFTGHVPVFAQTVPGTDFLCLWIPGQEHTYTHLHQMTARYTRKCYSSPSWSISPVCCMGVWFGWFVGFGWFYLKTLTWLVRVLVDFFVSYLSRTKKPHFHPSLSLKVYPSHNITNVTARRSSKRNVTPKGLNNPIRQRKILKTTLK